MTYEDDINIQLGITYDLEVFLKEEILSDGRILSAWITDIRYYPTIETLKITKLGTPEL